MKFIYAIDLDGVCLYVGCSVTPRLRFYSMRSRVGNRAVKLRIIRKVGIEYARIESQVIRAYKRRGECELNKETFPKQSRSFYAFNGNAITN